MRCPSCEKFVSYDEPECEEQDSAAVDGTTVTANVRVVLKCADCGDELKEATFDLEGEAALKAKCKAADESEDAPEHEWEVVDASYDPTDRYESIDKKGRAIPSRFQQTYELDLGDLIEALHPVNEYRRNIKFVDAPPTEHIDG